MKPLKLHEASADVIAIGTELGVVAGKYGGSRASYSDGEQTCARRIRPDDLAISI
jgi:hypothetical protein